jgi:hypothetical protein
MSQSKRKSHSRGRLPYLKRGMGELAGDDQLSGGPAMRTAKRHRVREILAEELWYWRSRALSGGGGLAGARA